MRAPQVSVVIPAYNAASHIDAAIASVLSQAGVDLEVVVVDDVSTDHTAAAVTAWSARDPRVRLLRAEVNGGPARTRNLAIAASRGEWLALLDSDDAFAPERLVRLLDVAADTAADLLADNLRLVDATTGEDLGVALPIDPAGPRWLVAAGSFIERSGFTGSGFDYGYLKPLIRRAFLDEHGIRYREDLRIGEDFHLYLDCLLAGARFVLVPEATYTYRLAPGSASRRLADADLARLAAATGEIVREARRRAPHLVPALRVRERGIARMRAVIACMGSLKAGRPHRALWALVKRPDALPLVARYGCESAQKRLGLVGFHGLRVRRAGS